MLKDIFYGIADVMEWSFEVFIESPGYLPSILITALLFIGTCYWLTKQVKFNKQADSEGVLK